MLLVTSDIHCTDKPRDKYRFDLFPWLREQQFKYKVWPTFILGDLTDAKDRHSAKLVNSLIDGLRSLRPPVYILKGNHDYIDPDNPFFRFLRISDAEEGDQIIFVSEPEELWVGETIFMIPHQPDQASLDAAFKRVPEGSTVFMHQTITGAISETGAALTGLSLPPNKAAAIYSGDIHVPHTLNTPNGDVTYVGAPYHIRFGDQYTPRVLLIGGKVPTNLHFAAPRKGSYSIRDVAELGGLKAGDQVKLTMELTRAELVEWVNIKQEVLDYCNNKGIEVYGLEIKKPPEPERKVLVETKTPLGYFTAFCNNENLSNVVREAGTNLIRGGANEQEDCNNKPD